MSKSRILIALALVLTACGSDEGAITQSTSFPESTGGSASTTTTTVVQETGGSATKATGGSATNVAGTSSVVGTGAPGGSNTGTTTTTGGSTGSTTVGGSTTQASGGAGPGAGGNGLEITGGSSGQTTNSGGSTQTTGGYTGRTPPGGSTSTGGSSIKATGGSQATGGSTTQATGGSPSTGGSTTSTATGGTAPQATGGSPSTGGSSTTATGGSDPGAGGSPTTGGTTTQATGGSAPTVTTLYEGITVPAGTYPGSENHGIIRTDASNIYWATYRDLSSDHSTLTSIIRKMPKTGGAPTTIITAPSSSAIGDLVVSGGFVYWMEWVQSTGQVKINKATIDGTSPTTLATIASPYKTTRPVTLTLRTDGAYLFWVGTPMIRYDTTGWASDTFTRIDKVSVNGGAVSALATVVGGSTWDVTLGGDTSVICYKMIVAGEYSPTSTGWYSTARPSIGCSSPTNPMVNLGQIPSFAVLGESMTGPTTYSNGSAYLRNGYGISDTLHTTAENTLLKVSSAGNYLESDATHLFYLADGQIYQASLTTWVYQPLAPVTTLRSMTSDGSTLFWVSGVNIYSKAKL